MSKMKTKEMLFDLESSELIEMDSKANPVQAGDSPAKENSASSLKNKADNRAKAEGNKQEEKNNKSREEKLLDLFSNGKEKSAELLASSKDKSAELLKAGGRSAGKFFAGLSSDMKKGGLKGLIRQNKMTLLIGALIVVLGGGIYAFNYTNLPKLSKIHEESSGGDYRTYDAEVHPMQILSTVKENMADFKGEPSSKGDGKTDETRYVSYSLDWFGKARKTVIYYDSTGAFNRIKLEIGNESATDVFDKLKNELGLPSEDHNPTVKEGWAIWIKDSVKYKMMHRGSYTQLDMTIAKYDNSQALHVGKYPVIIQSINNIDLNGDKTINEKILLLGNRELSTNIDYSTLYLLVWDGTKTYVQPMNPEFDGGAYPQVDFYDKDKDGAEDIVISAERNIVNNYNVFKYTGSALENIYSGYEEPGLNE